MKLKHLMIVLEVTGCLAVLCLAYRYIAEQVERSTVPVTVKVYDLGGARPGSRVGFVACCGLARNPMVVGDVRVSAVNQKDHTITVQVTPEQAQRLAAGGTFMLAGEDAVMGPPTFPSLSWWRRFLR